MSMYTEGAEEIKGFALRKFTIQSVLDQLCDGGTIDWNVCPLEPFRVVDTRRVRVCEIPGRSVVSEIP